MRFLYISLILLFISFLSCTTAFGQKEDDNTQGELLSPKEETPNVYLDCSSCDYNHIRREVSFVNYVRDPEMANIHVFITDEGTGGGGREYEFSFMGRGVFQGTEYSLKHYIGRDATSEETRKALNSYLKKGYASFMLQTPLGKYFSLDYEGLEEASNETAAVEDPWNNWVFEVYAGSINFELESNQNDFDSRWGFYADRVTENWKVRFRPYFNYSQDEIHQSENEDPVVSKRHRHGLESYAIKSLNEHWSAGLYGTYLTENERNYRHEISLNPGIEYSLFPYEMATRKSITFTYQMGYTYADYYDETIFGYTEQNLLNQQIEGKASILQPWGNIETGLVGSHYLYDSARRRLEFYGQISVRITEGLSLNFQTDYNVIQDQLSLRAGEASLEEVLLQQRELATDFSFYGSVAISYTFGSEFSNIVNTRF